MNALSPNRLVVLVDDDHGPMTLYEEALREVGYEVQRIRELPAALDYVRETKEIPYAWIVDVMMPVLQPEKLIGRDGTTRLGEVSNSGLTAGLVLYRSIRDVPKFRNIPLILFTSVPSGMIIADIEKTLSADPFAICESKMNILPFEMPSLLETLADSSSEP